MNNPGKASKPAGKAWSIAKKMLGMRAKPKKDYGRLTLDNPDDYGRVKLTDKDKVTNVEGIAALKAALQDLPPAVPANTKQLLDALAG